MSYTVSVGLRLRLFTGFNPSKQRTGGWHWNLRLVFQSTSATGFHAESS